MTEQSGGAAIRISLLGHFEVRAGPGVIIDRSWSRRKAKALLKLLALQKGRSLHREQVLDALWPDLEPAAAANNLHKNLHYLRTAFTAHGVAPAIVGIAGDLVVLSSDVWVDLDEFQRQAQRARTSRGDLALYERALAVYTGDLLPEDIYEDWAAQPREELRVLVLQLLQGMSHLYEAQGRPEPAAESLQRMLQIDPLHEDAQRSLMRLYAESGSRHRALQQYQKCRQSLERELGVGPSDETEALYHAIVEGRLTTRTPAGAARTIEREPSRAEAQLPYYGREQELELAEDLVEEALQGRGQALFIGGIAGIGKTRFAQQIVTAAEDSGAFVLNSRSYELETPAAYQPLRDMLRQVLEKLPGEAVTQALQQSLYLRRLLPAAVVGEHSRAPLLPAADPAWLQGELFQEASRLFTELAAARRGLVLWLDDLHAADEASLHLLHFVCRQLPKHPMFLIATYRSEEAGQDHPLAPFLASLRREHLIRQVTLGPLPERAMGLVIEQVFGGQPVERDLLREVADSAEGNPFYATELAHALVEEGTARLTGGRWQRRGTGAAPVPGAVQDLLDRRLQRLDDAALQVLRIAAVLGRTFDYGLLRRSLSLPERAILDALDDSIASCIVEETEVGYRFRHQLLREGIYHRLTRARRQQLHRIAASALEEGSPGAPNADPDVVGYHFAQSDEPWRAVPYLQSAGRRAASVFANDQAIGLYEQALTLLREHPQPAESELLASLLEELGDVVRRTGEIGRAVPWYEEALSLFLAIGYDGAAIRVRGKAALSHIMLGHTRVASELLGDTLHAMTEQWPQYVVARTYYLLAQYRWHSGQHRAALEAAEQALHAAEASGDVAQRAQAYEAMALACHSLGDWQRGVEYELNRQALGTPGFDTDEAFDAHL